MSSNISVGTSDTLVHLIIRYSSYQGLSPQNRLGDEQTCRTVMILILRVGYKNNSYIRETQENSIENSSTN